MFIFVDAVVAVVVVAVVIAVGVAPSVGAVVATAEVISVVVVVSVVAAVVGFKVVAASVGDMVVGGGEEGDDVTGIPSWSIVSISRDDDCIFRSPPDCSPSAPACRNRISIK